MARKRRLSKRDKRIRNMMQLNQRWIALMEDDEFKDRLFPSIQDVDPTFTGFLTPEGITLRYYLFNGEEILNGYDIAVLTEEGAFVYSRPFSDEDIPF